ncbi:MAG: hypothetical protein A2655_03625 [Candidatus Yanofskybacteria bacterium RIFCSPHIGHO2_01_FULL_43_42]|uniref:Uncharacterized protein n=1 Tax=Candidatus Yanofskybacteria bacterium RIFCSPLOWO2_01_FULL_43_22 TaxID=1802695 RepID=A0A1F8GHS8_9BACT|nr:MAG: hypothetical protein A2655_03625 [Candidatus Yanofskybacteria bacterium RIFCSPHIGHO2_01_FULL_43_42]OGN12930.1 MAG: hypothetical protein A3D48_03390 [Candidatus Yanofskybacteria bacterium RIFCSPHIGHO2_02_FULL_43_17]OGN23989.1 MAG: hypothetical protein A3A13_02865 [Candidatus Yanofskybacteria bacterium RIFCSPLOWO2_01_FULL_43_22]
MPPKKNLKLSPLSKRQKLPKNLAELNSLKCCHFWNKEKQMGYFLGIQTVLLVILLTVVR